MTHINSLFYFGILPGLAIQFLGALFYFVIFKGSSEAQLFYSLTKIFLVAWPLIWYKSIDAACTKNNQILRSAIIGIISGIIISGFIVAAFYGWKEYWLGFGSILRDKVIQLGILNSYVIFALFISILHSGIEEYYWRWFIFKGLRTKLSFLPAAIIGSLGFASHHFIIVSQFFPLSIAVLFTTLVALGGLFWIYLYAKTGTLIGSWVSHICADIAIMSIGYILFF